jgi:hypothetical protein
MRLERMRAHPPPPKDYGRLSGVTRNGRLAIIDLFKPIIIMAITDRRIVVYRKMRETPVTPVFSALSGTLSSTYSDRAAGRLLRESSAARRGTCEQRGHGNDWVAFQKNRS